MVGGGGVGGGMSGLVFSDRWLSSQVVSSAALCMGVSFRSLIMYKNKNSKLRLKKESFEE